MIEKLGSVFGNVASSESLVQEFYNACQKLMKVQPYGASDWKKNFEKARDNGQVSEDREKIC